MIEKKKQVFTSAVMLTFILLELLMDHFSFLTVDRHFLKSFKKKKKNYWVKITISNDLIKYESNTDNLI